MSSGRSYEGSIVFITGAGSGIGACMAARFAQEGATVLVADIDGEAASNVARTTPGATSICLDVSDGEVVRERVADALADHGKIDVLINNAAVCSDEPFITQDPARWIEDLQVSLLGSMLMAQAVLPNMVSNRSGVILNVSSVNAVADFGNESYSAAKAGLLSFTRSLAVRYGPMGVRSNSIVPGTVQTPVWRARQDASEGIMERLSKWYPLGRLGLPEDVAAAAVFLAGPEATWITGTSLVVDGGLTAGNPVMASEILGY